MPWGRTACGDLPRSRNSVLPGSASSGATQNRRARVPSILAVSGSAGSGVHSHQVLRLKEIPNPEEWKWRPFC